jgi:hypothetical protein
LLSWPLLVGSTIRGHLNRVESQLRHGNPIDSLNLNRTPDLNALDLSVLNVGDDGFDVSMRNTSPGPRFVSVEAFNLTIADNTFDRQILRIAVPHTRADAEMIQFGVRFDPLHVEALLMMVETAVRARARPKIALSGDVVVKLFSREARIKVQRSNLSVPRPPDIEKLARFVTSPMFNQTQTTGLIHAIASVELSLPYTLRIWLGEVGGFILRNGQELAEFQIDKFALHPGTTRLKASGRANASVIQTDEELRDALNPAATSDLSLTIRGRSVPTNAAWLNDILRREQNLTISRRVLNAVSKLFTELDEA